MTTPQKTGHAPSEWPLALILDEAWIRTRRVLVQSLERAGCWLDASTWREVMAAEKRRGDELTHRLLTEIVGDDFPALRSESVFGSLNREFRRKLPFVLSFGWGMGYHLAALRGMSGAGYESADTTAVFNLGISIFDVIVD